MKEKRQIFMPWRTDIERHRVRRTLSEVKRKLEEALRLSRLQNNSPDSERDNGNSALTHRHR
jgi:hypothetical protein